MKIVRPVLVCVVALALAGCSRGLLGNSNSAPSAEPQIAVNNELTLPPDLSLRTPGTGVAPAPKYQSSAADPSSDATIYNTPAPAPAPGARNPRDPMQVQLDKYNISRLKPDGTVKTRDELMEELRQSVLAERRKKNPNYGTIFNAGDLFKDE